MSRSASYYESGTGRGMGFRDSCQDLLGFVHLIPDAARQRILDIASTQFENGSAYHQYQPLTKQGNSDIGSGFNDDPLWLIAGTAAYLKETGDYSILDEMTPFDCNKENTAPLMEHLRRSFNNDTSWSSQPAAYRACRLERLSEPQLFFNCSGRIIPDYRTIRRTCSRISVYSRNVC